MDRRPAISVMTGFAGVPGDAELLRTRTSGAALYHGRGAACAALAARRALVTRHMELTIDHRPLVDDKSRCVDVGSHPGLRQRLETVEGADGAAHLTSNYHPPGGDRCAHFGAVGHPNVIFSAQVSIDPAMHVQAAVRLQIALPERILRNDADLAVGGGELGHLRLVRFHRARGTRGRWRVAAEAVAPCVGGAVVVLVGIAFVGGIRVGRALCWLDAVRHLFVLGAAELLAQRAHLALKGVDFVVATKDHWPPPRSAFDGTAASKRCKAIA